MVRNQPLASEMSAIGIRHDAEADAEGEASGGAGENAGAVGEGVAAWGVLSAPELVVGLGVVLSAASGGTAPQAAAAQQIATNAAAFARMSFIDNVGAWPAVSR
jgi:hypothetical protein